MIRRNEPPRSRGWLQTEPQGSKYDNPNTSEDNEYWLDHAAERAMRAWSRKDADRRRNFRKARERDRERDH
jgi:hypothetical protein